MTMLELDLPEEVSAETAKLMLSIKLYELGLISAGKAAEVAGVTKTALLQRLSEQQISVFNYPPDDLDLEFREQA